MGSPPAKRDRAAVVPRALLEVEDLFQISLPNNFLANHPRF